MSDPQEQHREALNRLNGLLEDEFLITAYEPFLRGCRDILLRHAPDWHFHLGVYVCSADHLEDAPWEDCPDWRDAAGTEAQGAEEWPDA